MSDIVGKMVSTP